MIGLPELLILLIPIILMIKYPSLRKALGLASILIGLLFSLTGLGAIIGIPMIVIGAIFYFVGNKDLHSTYGGQLFDNTRIKRNVVVRVGSKTAKCPVCSEIIDITDRSEGTCPNCKNPLVIFYQE